MPTLKQLTCTIEWTGNNVPLREFQTTYYDGFVHTHIAVPPTQTPFSVHLTSHGYIAPGLAMFVYMDGEYQCNRNRRNLKIPDRTTKPYQVEVDFRVRQKEELQPDHSFIGHQWRFKELNTVPNVQDAVDNPAPYNAEYVGTIEVVVLRCYPADDTGPSLKQTATSPNSKTNSKRHATSALSRESSTEESNASSDDASDSGFGGRFDGAIDKKSEQSSKMPFGGDASWDDGDWNNTARNEWSHAGPNMNNGSTHGQGWGAPSNSPRANNAATAAAASSQGWDVAPAQWDTRLDSSSEHFSVDWTSPSQTAREPTQRRTSTGQSNRGSRRSHRPSVSNRPAPVDTNNWSSNNAGQASPAIVINVNQGRQRTGFGPPSVADSWNSVPLHTNNFSQPPQGATGSPNGSQKSGSNQSGSQNQQATAGANEDWEAEAAQVPGAWNESNDKAQDSSWNNHDSGNDAGWDSNVQEHDGPPENSNDDWNHGANDGNWDRSDGTPLNEQGQQNQWTSEQAQAVYPEWASPTVLNQNPPSATSHNKNAQPQSPWLNGADISNASAQHQNAWASGNGDWNSNGSIRGSIQPSQHQQSGNMKNATPDVPIGLFGGRRPIPASESSKREGPVLAKEKNADLGSSFGSQPRALRHPLATSVPFSPAGFVPAAVYAKPYWSTWNHTLQAEEAVVEPEPEPVQEPEEPEGPVYNVPADVAQRNSTSHQVQTGKPAFYLHKVSKPKYMDTHENPYAAFTFHYRSKAVIEKMFGVSLDETEEEEKERLSSLSKEQLIEEYIKAKANAPPRRISSSAGESKPSDVPTNAGLGFSGELAKKLAQINVGKKTPSNKPASNPDLHWGRLPDRGNAGWNNDATIANNNVTGWLSNGGGGGMAASPVANRNVSGSSNNRNGGNGLSHGYQQPGPGVHGNTQWSNGGNGRGSPKGNQWNNNGSGGPSGPPASNNRNGAVAGAGSPAGRWNSKNSGSRQGNNPQHNDWANKNQGNGVWGSNDQKKDPWAAAVGDATVGANPPPAPNDVSW